MRQHILRPVIVALLATGCVACGGSTAKTSATTAAEGGVQIQPPTQSLGPTASQPPASGTGLPPLTEPPPTTIIVPSSVPQTYVVQAGDQLKRIAKKFGVDLTELVTINSIANADVIREGLKLIIPAATAPGATAQRTATTTAAASTKPAASTASTASTAVVSKPTASTKPTTATTVKP